MILLGLALPLAGRSGGRLPAWAEEAVQAARGDQPPAGAEAWVLLDRTEMSYEGKGVLRFHHLRLVRILEERGVGEGSYSLHSPDRGARSIRALKGWNLCPGGELVSLDKEDVLRVNAGDGAGYREDSITVATLPRVEPGSLVAFETQESVASPMGPVAGGLILQDHPVRIWELDPGAGPVRMDRLHFSPWLPEPEAGPGSRLHLEHLPGLPRGEGGHPPDLDILPTVHATYLDPDWPTGRRWSSWESLGSWYHGLFTPLAQAPALPALAGLKGLPGLRALWAWMGRELTYRMVYLNPGRSVTPAAAGSVLQRRYGDCKDLACFLAAQARELGFEACPVLARIEEGTLPGAEFPFPVFDHVIAALRLEGSLGLPSEVETPRGRFLLLDPTAPWTPLGRLPEAHRGGHLLLCTPQGGQWVAVPDGAIEPGAVTLNLAARATPRGALEGTLTLREAGNAWGLRSTSRERTPGALRDLLANAFGTLPPDARLDILSTGDPLDLERPFELVLAISHPRALTGGGQEVQLASFCLPQPPPPIQRAGYPRRYPVWAPASPPVTAHLEVALPYAARPLLPALAHEGAFFAIQWKGEAKAGPEGCTLLLDLAVQRKGALFPGAAREEGLAAWNKDRRALRTVLEDGLSFRLGGL